MKYVKEPVSLEKLLKEHRKNNCVINTYKLNFVGVDDCDVYNICQSFDMDNKTYIAGRVEKRNSEISCIRFFEKINKDTYKVTDAKLDMMQDPCMCTINNELVVGGTGISAENNSIYSWRTSFFKGKSINTLERFANSPEKMKDVRLIQTDRINIFTRPQGGKAKGGRIGFVTCNSINEINQSIMENAEMLEEHFEDECWGGVNQVHLLKNNLLGIVGHIATMSEGNVRHYYGMVFCFNPETKQSTELKIVAERKDFAVGAYKREDLIDVVFLGGMNRNGDGTATLYTGLSDAEAHCAVIKDPFIEYEEGVEYE